MSEVTGTDIKINPCTETTYILNRERLVFLAAAVGTNTAGYCKGLPKEIVADRSVVYADKLFGMLFDDANNDNVLMGVNGDFINGASRVFEVMQPWKVSPREFVAYTDDGPDAEQDAFETDGKGKLTSDGAICLEIVESLRENVFVTLDACIPNKEQNRAVKKLIHGMFDGSSSSIARILVR